ncbi:MAG: hypothetical protein ACE5KZ_13915 [Candidatus Scalinduaceae bacterium]
MKEIKTLQEAIETNENNLPEELSDYHRWIINTCKTLTIKIHKNLDHLSLPIENILENILKNTQNLTRHFDIINTKWAAPLLRITEYDYLSLKLLRWLHSAHPKATAIPFGVSNAEFAILPYLGMPVLYYLPFSSQQGLLLLPLFFHEFGHLLYVCHQLEMNDLVKSLQEKIDNLLSPAVEADDEYFKQAGQKSKLIVETWFDWTQEIFCDAVGYRIGGTAYLHAFSTYFRMFGREQFYKHETELIRSEHPVIWIRIRILADRARKLGKDNDAEMLENTWNLLAKTLEVEEEYFGFYDEDFLPLVQSTIDDMLVEADPFSAEESVLNPSPISMLNEAWKCFIDDPDKYEIWEKDAINSFINK